MPVSAPPTPPASPEAASERVRMLRLDREVLAGHERLQELARGGSLRAAIFGINDGLVSNLALVMGVAGAAPDGSFIVLAGVAGLLAGAFSMGAGEWISVRSQGELFARQIERERARMEADPVRATAEIARLYVEKGLPADLAGEVAERLMADRRHALDTKVREELGLDPSALGSAWGAAISSFFAFGIGALVPLLPFLVTGGLPAIVASFAAALAALFLVGAGVSLLTGRGPLYSGVRQVLIGGSAAVITYIVGRLIGVSVAG
ncbi:MAG: VIT1/CCC1 transporter family protein [Chloroflexota bacterium]